jgi:hypothetical protein
LDRQKDICEPHVWHLGSAPAKDGRTHPNIPLRAAITVERRPDASEGEQRPVVVEREPPTSFFFVSGFVSGAYSAKL